MSKFFICLFGGWFGLHKFIEGKTWQGVIYLCTFGLCFFGWGADCIVYLVKWLQGDSKPDQVANNSPYTYLVFKVAGVTFKNGRKTRQAILRALKWGDEEIESITLEPYEWEGKPAVYVKVNDQIIGNIPADTVETFYEYERKYKRDNIHCEVYGGNKLDSGGYGNYGSEITIRYLRDA